MKTTVVLSILIAALIIGGAIIVSKKNNGVGAQTTENNVSIVDGKQIIEIRARGGYLPERSIAKAGIPTILRFFTNGTFDCSASVRIANMNISKNLPQSGATDIDVGVQPVSTLQGTCGMGMYPFEVDFSS